MNSIRGLLGVAAALSVLALAGCKNTPNNAAEAANAANAASAANAGGSEDAALREVAEKVSRSVTIRPGTVIEVRLADPVGSARDRSGETFQATLAEPIMVNGIVVAPRGANVTGRVLSARPSGHLQTPAELAVTLVSLEVGGKSYPVTTSSERWRGRSHKKRDAEWIGGAAGAGALIGALVGHGKGAAIGAGIGAGGGTATAYATGKKDIYLPAETRLHFVLREPVTVSQGS